MWHTDIYRLKPRIYIKYAKSKSLNFSKMIKSSEQIHCQRRCASGQVYGKVLHTASSGKARAVPVDMQNSRKSKLLTTRNAGKQMWAAGPLVLLCDTCNSSTGETDEGSSQVWNHPGLQNEPKMRLLHNSVIGLDRFLTTEKILFLLFKMKIQF